MDKKEASDKQEKLIAKILGWRQVTGSGSRHNYPGDVSSEEWLGECKTHLTNHKITFKKPIWEKIKEEATARFKYPAYFTDNGSQLAMFTWVIIPERELPKDFTIVPYPKDVETSLSFDVCDSVFDKSDLNNTVFEFAFDTSLDKLNTKRHKLLLMKLSMFETILR